MKYFTPLVDSPTVISITILLVVLLPPYATLTYSALYRMIKHYSNLRDFILSSTLAVGATKLPKRYKGLSTRKEYENLFQKTHAANEDALSTQPSTTEQEAEPRAS
jgi:hypothetical protein